MSHLTPEELDKLARLCALSLTTEQKAKFLSQLDRIVTFVSQLDACPLDNQLHMQDHPAHDDTRLDVRDGVIAFDAADAILQNVEHPIERRMIVLETSTQATSE